MGRLKIRKHINEFEPIIRRMTRELKSIGYFSKPFQCPYGTAGSDLIAKTIEWEQGESL